MNYGIQRLLKECESILDSQWRNGMLPHVRYVKGSEGYTPGPETWGIPDGITIKERFKTSGITQPPIIAMMLAYTYESSRSKEILTFFATHIDAFINAYDFLLKERNPNGNGLISILHPWESGLDNSPVYDECAVQTRAYLSQENYVNRIQKRQDTNNVESSERPTTKDYELYGTLIDFFAKSGYDQKAIIAKSPFVFEDIIFNALFIRGLEGLELLCSEVIDQELYADHDHIATVYAYIKEIKGACDKAFHTHFFDNASMTYWCKDAKTAAFITEKSVHNLIPLILQSTPAERIDDILSRLDDPKQYAAPLPVPTTPLDSEQFNPTNYWRGPVWPIMNWFIIQGLMHHDKAKAYALCDLTLRAISEGYDLSTTYEMACALMEFNTVEDSFTTPSKNQYKHGWLWDSCFAMIGWVHMDKAYPTDKWEEIYAFKAQHKETYTPSQMREAIKSTFSLPLFYEYYAPTDGPSTAFQALGSDTMTWTASVYIDLYETMQKRSS